MRTAGTCLVIPSNAFGGRRHQGHETSATLDATIEMWMGRAHVCFRGVTNGGRNGGLGQEVQGMEQGGGYRTGLAAEHQWCAGRWELVQDAAGRSWLIWPVAEAACWVILAGRVQVSSELSSAHRGLLQSWQCLKETRGIAPNSSARHTLPRVDMTWQDA
eukprot:322622-Alexandrium_andersonii.AAC.1